MDKRDLLKGIKVGTMALVMGAAGAGKSVFAAEPDWRDDMLSGNFNANVYEKMDRNGSDFIHVFRWKGNIRVQHGSYKYSYRDDTNFRVADGSIDKVTEHETLEDAYNYAKQLKEKYYSNT